MAMYILGALSEEDKNLCKISRNKLGENKNRTIFEIFELEKYWFEKANWIVFETDDKNCSFAAEINVSNFNAFLKLADRSKDKIAFFSKQYQTFNDFAINDKLLKTISADFEIPDIVRNDVKQTARKYNISLSELDYHLPIAIKFTLIIDGVAYFYKFEDKKFNNLASPEETLEKLLEESLERFGKSGGHGGVSIEDEDPEFTDLKHKILMDKEFQRIDNDEQFKRVVKKYNNDYNYKVCLHNGYRLGVADLIKELAQYDEDD